MVAFPFDTSHFKNIVCPVSPTSFPKNVSNDVDAQYRWAKNVLCCHNAHNGHVDVDDESYLNFVAEQKTVVMLWWRWWPSNPTSCHIQHSRLHIVRWSRWNYITEAKRIRNSVSHRNVSSPVFDTYRLQKFERFSNCSVDPRHFDRTVRWKIHISCVSSNCQRYAFDSSDSSPSLCCTFVSRRSNHGTECTDPAHNGERMRWFVRLLSEIKRCDTQTSMYSSVLLMCKCQSNLTAVEFMAIASFSSTTCRSEWNKNVNRCHYAALCCLWIQNETLSRPDSTNIIKYCCMELEAHCIWVVHKRFSIFCSVSSSTVAAAIMQQDNT